MCLYICLFSSNIIKVNAKCKAVAGETRPLFNYVCTNDPIYKYEDTGIRLTGIGWTGYYINMTSQTWLTPADVDRTVWWHQLVIIVPDKVTHPHHAAIYVSGDGNDATSAPKNTSEDIVVASFLATTTSTITATLLQVPNQPLVFTADPEHAQRGEDALVAFSWTLYMKNQNRPEYVSLLPMVKSVVRAMDTVTDYCNKNFNTNIQYFGIAGASKRGWTTWLTGVVDDRVVTIMPIVMDMLNFAENVAHMYRSYGGWTFAFKDYWQQNLTMQLGTENIEALQAIVDPLQYKSYLTMPKLVVDATGDEFFMPDDDWFWWGQLSGETYRLMVQNAEHTMVTGIVELLVGADAWFISVIENTPRPVFSWTVDNQGAINLVSQTQPTKVNMNYATTFDSIRRDFRLITGNTPTNPCKFIPVKVFGSACLNPVFWTSEDIAPVSVNNGTYTYVATQPLPPGGWRAFFLELYFPGPSDTSFRLTSTISIVPNTYPFPSCGSGASCEGTLV